MEMIDEVITHPFAVSLSLSLSLSLPHHLSVFRFRFLAFTELYRVILPGISLRLRVACLLPLTFALVLT